MGEPGPLGFLSINGGIANGSGSGGAVDDHIGIESESEDAVSRTPLVGKVG
jgi:hypothetical protein